MDLEYQRVELIHFNLFDNNGTYKSSITSGGDPEAVCITPGAHQYMYVSNSNDAESLETQIGSRWLLYIGIVAIVLPIARPGMAVLGMLTFLATWNDYLWPSVTISANAPYVPITMLFCLSSFMRNREMPKSSTFT